MPQRQLENLVGKGLKVETSNDDEVENLLRSGERRLNDAENATLSIESRFDLAYNAAHALSLAALPLAESWRQQPGSPVYITDLTDDESGSANGRPPTRRQW